MMRSMILAAVMAVGAGPVLADCADRIAFLEEAFDEVARTAISASSGGQGVAGAREAQAATDAGAATVPYDEAESAAGGDDADTSTPAGDGLLEARALLAEARTMADEGDDAACTDRARDVLVDLLQD